MKTIVNVLSLCLLVLNSCKKNETCTTCPPPGPDTTSHRFAWSQELLGDGGGSILRDVVIINDTLAYAVGEIFLRDSMGQADPLPYNLAVWNGRRWDIRRLNYRGSPPVIRFVFAISEQDIWFDPWFHWDGQRFNEIQINPVFIGVGWNKMWGSSDGQLYVVGNSGAIAYSPDRGTTWQRVESGTTLPIRDIWGATDPLTGEAQMLAVASDDSEKRLLQIRGTTVSVLSDSGLSNSVYALWFTANKKHYVVGAGIHHKNSLSDAIWSRYPSGEVTSYASGGIRGNGINDVFVVGSFFEVVHFNGASWYNYRTEIPFTNGALGGIAIKGNLVIAVGLVGQQAVAIVGRR